MKEKQVSYKATNTYSTLNDYSAKTRNIWVVFHGIGYLSRYFLKYFRQLNHEENYLIAPQAPSKYYLNGKYEHVGASWATREKTAEEMENVMNYLDEIFHAEHLSKQANLILFGYSQGVSVVARWIASRKIKCDRLIFHSGRLPTELKAGDFDFLKDTKVSFIYGTEDPYINGEFLETEEKRIRNLFPKNLEFIAFDGGHEVNKEIVLKLAEE